MAEAFWRPRSKRISAERRKAEIPGRMIFAILREPNFSTYSRTRLPSKLKLAAANVGILFSPMALVRCCQ